MKINRFFALATIAVAMLAVMGLAGSAFTQPALAQGGPGSTPTPQDQACDTQTQDDDSLEAANAEQADSDTVDQQCGDQNAADDGTESAEAPEADNEAPPTALGTPAITADVAQQTAEAYLNAGTASKVELDDENGALIYSVEIGGSDVKVDAMTGSVLGVESDAD